jgi:protocatechuate 3,4-dioxygenase beta subunit
VKRPAILATFAVAVLVGWWWWSRGSGSEPATQTAAERARTANAAHGSGANTSNSADPAFHVALADDDPPGALRLDGLVLDAAEHPVEGAIVSLSGAPPRTTTTDGGGAFAFDHLVARQFTVAARAAGGVAGPVTVRLTEKTEAIVLRLRAGAKVTVRVAGTDGKPIDGATVELRGQDVQSQQTAAGAATFAPVVPGGYEVVAWAPGTAKVYQTVRVAGEAMVRVQLVAGAAVSGRVLDDRGAAVAGARVAFLGAGDLRTQPDARRDGVTSGPDGTWRFDALPAGSYRFVANDAEHAQGTSSIVTLDGAKEKSDVAITMPTGALVRGRVVDSSKLPVIGARVSIAVAWQRRGGGATAIGARQAPRIAYSDASGGFELRGVPRGELQATALHDKGAASFVTVDTTSGDVSNVTLTIDLTAILAGVVVDPAGQPVEGAQVSATARAGFDPAQAFARRPGGGVELTDAGGRFRFTGLAPGGYTVHASRSGRPQGGGRRGGASSDGVDAEAGDEHVKVVLPAEGGVQGKVALQDGSSPAAFTVVIGPQQQSFVAGGAFALDAIAPGDYQLTIRGPSFDTVTQDVTIEPNKTADVGTIALHQGRRVGGIVVQGGQPVANATVYAGRQVMGGGATNDAPLGGGGGLGNIGTKSDTTDGSGAFAMAGFGDGDLVVIADLPGVGRSKPQRVTEDAQNQTQLVLELQPYGSLSGTMRQGGQPVPSVPVTVQSTTAAGAIYVVTSGPDGAYRFDNLAPDTYKVSATVRSGRIGMHFYSKQVDVPASQNVVVDLVVAPGQVTVDVQAVAADGKTGIVIGYLASAAITTNSAQDLQNKLAAAGPGTSQLAIGLPGIPTAFTDVTAPGTYTACIVPLPLEVQVRGGMSYFERHAGTLPAFCQPVQAQPAPDTQTVQINVQVPAMINDPPGTGTRGGGGTVRPGGTR